MSSRMSDAMAKLNIENSRNSVSRAPVSPAGGKRNSQLDPSTINSMFPDAAAAIAQQKAEYTQQTGNTISNRNSQAVGDRLSVPGPGLSATRENKTESMSQNWRHSEQTQAMNRPKSSDRSVPPPMGQFSQPPPSAGLKSPRPFGPQPGAIQNTTLNAPEHHEIPILSPYNVGNQSWASMTNTPMVSNFNTQQAAAQSDMIANATAMKLAALSTVNNRIALDDVKKYRRARSNEPKGSPGLPPVSPGIQSTGIPGINTIMVDNQGQVLNAQQIAALQARQIATAQGRRSRPNSPGLPLQAGMPQPQFSSPQHNGYLSAFDGNQMMLNAGLMGQYQGDGYLSEHGEIPRGRSPRGRRGSSKPPEDPTDPKLLEDIPSWLRSLRLHKYTDNLKDLTWSELVMLDDKGLEARGVNALGARNKMLKVCWTLYSADSVLIKTGL